MFLVFYEIQILTQDLVKEGRSESFGLATEPTTQSR
jgi:hypothetical protein